MNKALIVGINQYAAPNQLFGCVNDANGMATLLKQKLGFSTNDIQLLTDSQAIRSTIMTGLMSLVQGATAGDKILFYFSGHGSFMTLTDPDTGQPGVHDVLCPVDVDWTPQTVLSDLDFRTIFTTIPPGVEFIWVADACYSGGLFIVSFRHRNKIKSIPPPERVQREVDLLEKDDPNKQRVAVFQSPANLAFLAACAATELAVDCFQGVNCNSLFTFFLLNTLNAGSAQPDLTSLVNTVAQNISTTSFTQTPQLKGDPSIIQRPFLTI